MSLHNILAILEQYKYIVIFPIMIFEGPIITVISGFLVYLGFLNIFIIYPMLIVGDLIGDSMYYAIGKYGHSFEWIQKIEKFLGYTDKSEEFLKNHFEKHTTKTLLLAKVSHGLGIPIQISAGMAEVDFLKYLYLETIATIPKTLVLLAIGFYLGDSYVDINNYLHLLAVVVITIVTVVLLFLILNRYVKKFLL